MVEAWAQAEDQNKPLLPILPIIVYHGKKTWKKRDLVDYFEGMDSLLIPFIPSFDYILVDMKDLTDEEILSMNAGLLINTLLLFKHYGEKDYIKTFVNRLFSGLEPFIRDNTSRNKISNFVVYLWKTSEIEDEEFSTLLNQLPDPLKRTTMTTYQQIIEKGIAKGKIEGKMEAFDEVIANAFHNGLEIELISSITGLSSEQVRKRIADLGLKK